MITITQSITLDVANVADALASVKSDEQARFFNRFFLQLARRCEKKGNDINDQLGYIADDLSPCTALAFCLLSQFPTDK